MTSPNTQDTIYAKSFVNNTSSPLVVMVTMRAGADDVTKNGPSFPLSLDIGETVVKNLPDANPGGMPFLNRVMAISADTALAELIVQAKSRGDADDNLMNTYNALLFNVVDGKLTMTGTNYRMSDANGGALAIARAG